MFFVVPPYLDIFGMFSIDKQNRLDLQVFIKFPGRYALEPSGTACTIDYWHGNFRNYNYYVLYLVIMAYMFPISAM